MPHSFPTRRFSVLLLAGLLGVDGNCGKETRRHQRLPQVSHFSAVIQLTAFEPGQNVDMLRCEDEIARRRKPAEAGTRSCFNGQCVIACPRLRIEQDIALTDLREGIALLRSEEHTSELQSLMRTSYAVFCLKKQKIRN